MNPVFAATCNGLDYMSSGVARQIRMHPSVLPIRRASWQGARATAAATVTHDKSYNDMKNQASSWLMRFLTV